MVKQLTIPMRLADWLATGVRVALEEANEHLLDEYTVNLSDAGKAALAEAAVAYEEILAIILEQRGYGERPGREDDECDAAEAGISDPAS